MAIGIGVDVGSSSVRVAVLERGSDGTLTLRATQEAPCDTARADALTNALTQLRRTLSVTQPVVLGMPSTSVILTTVNPLVANPRRAVLGVQFELQQQLPFDLREVAWHYRWLTGPNGHATTEPPAGVVAAVRRSLLDDRLACCRRAGLNVQAVAVNPLATWNAWAQVHQAAIAGASAGAALPAAVLVHAVNEDVVEWILAARARFHVVPLAHPGWATAAGQAGDVVVQALAASWEALRQDDPDLPTKVWTVGSATTLPVLEAALSKVPGLDVARFEPGEAIKATAASAEMARGCATALGLALQGLGLARLPLNFLTASQSEARAKRATRIAMAASAVCAVVALGFGASAVMEIRHRRAALLEALAKREALYQSLRPDVRALLQRQEAIQLRGAQLEQLAGERAFTVQLVAYIAEALPETVWLTKLECAKNGTLEGLVEGQGRSFQDVTQFLERLKGIAGITVVKPLSSTVTIDETSGKELIVFAAQISGRVRPEPVTPE
jgi:Tfp pilus assembly protein PilN